MISPSPVKTITLPNDAEIISITKSSYGWEIKYTNKGDEECQHESDGLRYDLSTESPINVGVWVNADGPITCTPYRLKCKKCGEFYR